MRSTVMLTLTLVIGGGFFFYKERADRMRELEALRQEVRVQLQSNAPNAKQPNSLQYQLLARAIEGVAPAPTVATPQPSPPIAASAATPLMPEEEERARSEEASVRMASAFDGDTREPRWATQAESSLQGALAARDHRCSSLGTPECRGSICRVEISHDSEDARREFVRAAFAPPDFWEGERVALRTSGADGKVSTLMYFGRSGRPIPGE